MYISAGPVFIVDALHPIGLDACTDQLRMPARNVQDWTALVQIGECSLLSTLPSIPLGSIPACTSCKQTKIGFCQLRPVCLKMMVPSIQYGSMPASTAAPGGSDVENLSGKGVSCTR